MKLWLIGQFIRKTKDGAVWEFQGIVDSEEKARSACTAPNIFFAPIELNYLYPDERSVSGHKFIYAPEVMDAVYPFHEEKHDPLSN